MKILGNSDITNVALSFARGENSLSKQQQQREEQESSPSSLPLQALVALASSLFDEATLKDKQLSQEQQKRQQHECSKQEVEHKHQLSPSPPVAVDAIRHEPQTNIPMQQVVTSVDSIQETLTKKIKNRPAIVHKSITSPNQNLIVQHSNLHCCTREGFLSRLRSVLNDALRSDVLSWMPDGKAFTIVSSRKFAKTGLVYELFGIRKMSSFLRRLNQLGFARVRDPTDPKNLDVFRKAGFEASAAIESKRTFASVATSNKVHSLESPTSTIMIVPKTIPNDEDTSEDVPRNSMDLSLPGSSPIFGRARASSSISSSSSVTTTSTLTASSVDSPMTYSTPASVSWACSTPDIEKSSQSRPLESDRYLSIPRVIVKTNRLKISHPPLPWVSMPPAMPASSMGGPVVLRARSERHDEYVSTPSSVSSSLAPLLPPPKLALQSSAGTAKTPKTANRCSLELSPGTLQILKVPNLVNDSDSDASTIFDTRMAVNIHPPPQMFIDECMKQFVYHPSKQTPISMEVEREFKEDRHKSKIDQLAQRNVRHSQSLGMTGAQHCLRLQHQREYLSLWLSADIEADAILVDHGIDGKKAV